MRSPFPGMDPYLERSWGDVAGSLVHFAKVSLNGQLPDALVARADRRTFPDAEHPGADPMRQPFIRILDSADGERVVTAIEFVSAANKSWAAARDSYRQARREWIEARVNLVEVDLARAGTRDAVFERSSFPAGIRGEHLVSVYRTCSGTHGRREVYGLQLRERLPGIRVPLRAGDPDIVLDLQSLVDQTYDGGAYGRSLDYRRDLDPPLAPEDAAWADELLRSAGRIQ